MFHLTHYVAQAAGSCSGSATECGTQVINAVHALLLAGAVVGVIVLILGAAHKGRGALGAILGAAAAGMILLALVNNPNWLRGRAEKQVGANGGIVQPVPIWLSR